MIQCLEKTKASCVDPSRFKDKKEALELRDRKLKDLGADAEDLIEFKRHEGLNFDEENDSQLINTESESAVERSKRNLESNNEIDYNDQDPIILHMNQSFQNIRQEIDRCGRAVKAQKKIIDLLKTNMINVIKGDDGQDPKTSARNLQNLISKMTMHSSPLDAKDLLSVRRR